LDIFKNPTSRAPKKDDMVVRVDLEKPQLAGKAPTPVKAGNLGVRHVPNAN
jgi:hypothetical protein